MKSLTGQGFLSVLARSITFVANIAVLGLLSRFLPTESFGAYTVRFQLALTLTLLNVFVGGDGLRNALVKSSEPKKMFMSVFYAALIFYLGLAFCVIPLYHGLISLILLRLPFQISQSAFLASGKAYIQMKLEALEAIATLATIYFSIKCNLAEHDLFVCMRSTALFASASTFAYLMIYKRWNVCRASVKTGFKTMISFMPYLLQRIALISLISIVPFLVAKLAGLTEAGNFNLLYRLFFILNGVFIVFFTPMWADYPRAERDGDEERLWKNFHRATRLTFFFFGLGGAGLILLHKQILWLWTGKEISNYTLASWFALFVLIQGLITNLSLLMVGLSQVRKQLQATEIGLSLHLVVSLTLFEIFQSTGILIGAIIGMIPITLTCTKEVYDLHQSFARRYTR